MPTLRIQIVGVTASLLFCAFNDVAFGDDQHGSGPVVTEPALEEIVVTARRREESLADMPISMSALSAVEIERSQIDDLATLQYAVPGLTVTPFPGSPTRANVGMRGQLEPDLLPTVDPAVGVYLDGVYAARTGGANVELIDMERVEVLRGPQGTLFGRNTTGGAINLIPVGPGPDFASEFMAGGGSYDRRDARAMVNIPFQSGARAIRVTAMHTEHGGYGYNRLLNLEVNKDNTDFLRAQLGFTQKEQWHLNFSFDLTQTSADRNLLTLLAAFPPVTTVPAAAGNPEDRLDNYEDATARTVYANRSGASAAEVWGAAGTLEADLDRVSIKAISAYRAYDNSNRDADLDGTPYDLFTVLERDERQHQISHDLQAYGRALRDRLDWMAGLHYFEESVEYAHRIGGVSPTTLVVIENMLRGTAKNDSFAGFAELTYAIMPGMRVTAGVRHNRDRRQLISRNARGVGGSEFCTLDPRLRDELGVCQVTLPVREFKYVPWMLGIDFKPSNHVLTYAKISRGYRAGGYNMRGTTESDLDTFGPERVTAFESGARVALYDDRVRFGLALHRTLFDDVQLRQQAPVEDAGLTLRLTQNGGEALITGGELDLTATAGGWLVAGRVGVTDAKYTRLDSLVTSVTLDSNFLHTPRKTLYVSVDRHLKVGFGEVNLHADYGWRDDVPFSYDRQSLARQNAYGLINAMISARFHQPNMELTLWARNLADQRYLVRAVDWGSLVTAIPGDPRTVGVRLTCRFGMGR